MSVARYPVGRFEYPDTPMTEAMRAGFIREIAEAPMHLRTSIEGLTTEQLETPYRDGGWTVRQVVHHVPDSHMNAYTRFKLALTEENPTIKPYAEDGWATLPDVACVPVDVSLALLDALHARWVGLLRSLTPSDFARTFQHPESGPFSLDRALAMYAWHGRHHVAHITGLRDSRSWT